MTKLPHRDLRQAMVEACRTMNRIGLNQGTSGNLSHRVGNGLLITPTSLSYDAMKPKDIVAMGFDGHAEGRRRPSSEWRFHRDILASRADAAVVLHAHATYATTLAVHGRGIPAFHYMVAVAGGADVRCAPYACFGTQELSDRALAALEGRTACLLGHHGLIVLGESLERALWRAVEVETLAKMYVHALAIGEPPHLTSSQMDEVMARFRSMGYGETPTEVSPSVEAAPPAPPAARTLAASVGKASRTAGRRRPS